MREGIRTLLRIVICAGVLWSLEIGSYQVPLTLGAALAVAVVMSVLTFYELGIRDVPPPGLAGAVGAIFALVIGGFAVWHALQPPPPTGLLRPANEPTPRLSCPARPGPGDLVILFGTDARIGQGNGPFTAFRVGDCPVLSLTRTPKGLAFSDVGYDYDNDIAFMIRNGVYQPELPLELRVLRPDASTYVLLDHYDQEVLYIRYLNRNAVRIRGRFLCGESPQAEIRDDRILLGGIRVAGVTLGQHAVAGHACLKAGAEPMPPRYLPARR